MPEPPQPTTVDPAAAAPIVPAAPLPPTETGENSETSFKSKLAEAEAKLPDANAALRELKQTSYVDILGQATRAERDRLLLLSLLGVAASTEASIDSIAGQVVLRLGEIPISTSVSILNTSLAILIAYFLWSFGTLAMVDGRRWFVNHQQKLAPLSALADDLTCNTEDHTREAQEIMDRATALREQSARESPVALEDMLRRKAQARTAGNDGLVKQIEEEIATLQRDGDAQVVALKELKKRHDVITSDVQFAFGVVVVGLYGPVKQIRRMKWAQYAVSILFPVLFSLCAIALIVARMWVIGQRPAGYFATPHDVGMGVGVEVPCLARLRCELSGSGATLLATNFATECA